MKSVTHQLKRSAMTIIIEPHTKVKRGLGEDFVELGLGFIITQSSYLKAN
jgi:hypothetical protein